MILPRGRIFLYGHFRRSDNIPVFSVLRHVLAFIYQAAYIDGNRILNGRERHLYRISVSSDTERRYRCGIARRIRSAADIRLDNDTIVIWLLFYTNNVAELGFSP